MKFNEKDRVEDVRTGWHGTVVDTEDGQPVVSWNPNQHGGYIDRPNSDEIRHGDCNAECECTKR